MPTPDYNFKNGKEYIGEEPLITITEKDGFMLINGRTAIEIFTNTGFELEFAKKIYSTICRSPNLRTAALELFKEHGMGSIDIIKGLVVVLDIEITRARVLYEILCYPTIVEYLKSQGKYS